MLLREWVEVPGRFVLDLRVEIKLRRKMRMFDGEAFSHQPRTFSPVPWLLRMEHEGFGQIDAEEEQFHSFE
ncbi:hypothetical protein Tco_0450204 [Tanacetum coccineum]